MIQVIDRTNIHSHLDSLRSFAELRYQTFITRYDWRNISGTEKFEQDQFDTEEAIYLVVHNKHGDVIGGARLLDTSRNCLLGEIFPYLVDGAIPSDPRVFEVTRFVVDHRRDRLTGCGNVCAELLWGLQEYGSWAGLTHLVSVSYLTLEPVLRRAGYCSRRMGKTFQIDGQDVAALEHDVNYVVRQQSSQRVNVDQTLGLSLLPPNAFTTSRRSTVDAENSPRIRLI